MSRFYSSLHIETTDREQLVQDIWMLFGKPESVEDEIHIHSPDEARQLPGAGPEQIRAFLSPVINGWISIFTERVTEGEELARELSSKRDTWAVFLWTDPARAWGYSIFENGIESDEFVSNLVYYDGNSEEYPENYKGGKPREYSELLEDPNDVNDLINLLQLAREVASDDPLDTSDKSVERIENEFEMFRKALGIPHAKTDYDYMIQGDSSNVLRWNDFLHIAID